MTGFRGLLLLWLSVLAAPAFAQTIVTSAAPDNVAVTVYRDPNRPSFRALELQWLEGFALISETRRVTLPAGEVDLRFEGVAGGILPQSAIVTGLPDGIVERNRDAYLLSPGTLLDRSLGRRVHLRRTSRATGEVREQEAIIRSGARGGVVLQTDEGFEALRCTGLAESLVYDEVPPGLSARPTLSVRTRSREPVSATVTLSYLAGGFDWQANYVATLAPDGEHVDLFAWLTLANGDETGFRQANTQAVAGRLNREDVDVPESEASPLRLDCWPQGTTSDLGDAEAFLRQVPPPPPPPPVMMSPMSAVADESITVTGSRIMAQQEDLGDLKLYRIPEPVTVAANSQKQVALLHQPEVEVDIIYRTRFEPNNVSPPQPTPIYLVTRNRPAEGLGLPLPAGGLVLFTESRGRPILIGEGSIGDSAVGEDVEIRVSESADVMMGIELVEDGEEVDRYRLTVTNASPRAVRFEAELDVDSNFRFDSSSRVPRRDGRPLWTARVPANGTASFTYSLREIE
ncbi:MAG TPA: hypothetical protein VFO69_02040 [Allosphingosinicella sp.]|nr:hypothetical protein [Allosphingosinicella sp.]